MSDDLFDHSASETGEISAHDHGEAGTSGVVVPMAEALPDPDEAVTTVPPVPTPFPQPVVPQPLPSPFPLPPFHLCVINLKEGCYRITFRPNSGINILHGTMRVDNFGGKTTISGDLYRFLRISLPVTGIGPVSPATTLASPPIATTIFTLPLGIPIYARNKYYSYLKVTGIQKSPLVTTGPCKLTLTAQEYVYTQPPAGSFNGTFPAAPGSRTVTIVLSPAPAPAGFTGAYFD